MSDTTHSWWCKPKWLCDPPSRRPRYHWSLAVFLSICQFYVGVSFWTVECFATSKVKTNVRSAVFRPWHRPTVVLPLVCCPSMTHCLKSAQKSASQVYQVPTVPMETRQLVLSQFKTFYHSQFRIEYEFSLPKIISECCELVKLCHRCPDFWDAV